MDDFLTSNPDEIAEASSHRAGIERRTLNIQRRIDIEEATTENKISKCKNKKDKSKIKNRQTSPI